jgi:NAD(P)-dependent dehydrogenase (short-subunit alcohol dehydrogenase family)/acyl carrier protein
VPVSAGALQPDGRRVWLPAYPYERKYYWIEADPVEPAAAAAAAAAAPTAPLPVDDWFTVPTWRQVVPTGPAAPPARCLAFVADGLAARVVAGLRAAGVEVVEVVAGEGYGQDADGRYTVRPGRHTDYERLVADLVVGGGFPARVVHAWPVTGQPAGGDVEAAQRAQDLGFFSLLSLTQAVAAAQLADPVQLDLLTAGSQDVTGLDLVRPEHATVAGVAKVVPQEVPSLTVRHVDVDPAGDRRAAADAVAELLRAPSDPAVALRHGRRWVADYQPVPIPAPTDPAAGLRERGVYLITGGLGGLGRTLAEDLANRVRARLILLGRSGPSPGAIAAVRRMEAAGAEVLVLAADVSDVDDLRRVREQALGRFGRLDGIVHAAGVPGGGMAEVKERAAAEQVLAPKLAGTLALRQAFGDLDLDFVALFSSVIAVAGGFGQVDYCAANAFLDAVARSPDQFGGRTLSIDWGPWREVGMAAEAGQPVGEPVEHPVLRTRQADAGGLVRCAGTVAPDTHWVLDQHRVAGLPVLPGTAQLELAGAALRTTGPVDGRAIQLRDVTFDQPLAVPTGDTAEVRVQLAAGDRDTAEFEVVSGSAEAGRVHARGTAGWVDPGPAPRHDLGAIRDRCAPEPADRADPAGERAGNLVTVGPHWPVPTRVYVGETEQLALIEAGQRVAAELDRYWLHPALLDRAIAFPRLPGGDGAPYLPFGYGRLLVRGPLPARLWSHVRYTGSASGEVIAADVSLLDDQGRELATVEDFLLRRVDAESVSTMDSPAAAAEPAGDEIGIHPRDGVDAFHRLLGTDLGPQVVVSPVPVERLLAEVGRQATGSVEADLDTSRDAAEPVGATAGQPRLVEGDYIAPRTELEATLARIWADVLGVGEVGVQDDLFELGGNSLLGVQLIAQVRKEVKVKLPMRTLFDAPTVAGMATRVEELRGTGTDESIPRLPRG